MYKFKDSKATSWENRPPLMDDFAVNYENCTKDSLSSDKFYKYKEQTVREHECLTTVEDSRSSKLDWELPELEVCYMETTHQAVKDICIDEGRPETDKTSFGRGKTGNKSMHIFSKRLEDKTDSGVELELFISGELEPSLLMDDSWYTGEVNDSAQSPDQVFHGKAVSARSSVASNDAGLLQQDVHASEPLDRITFNFNGLTVEQADLQGHKSGISHNLSDDRQVQCTDLSMNGKGTADENVQFLDYKGQRHIDGGPRITFAFKGLTVEPDELQCHNGDISDNLSDQCINLSMNGKGTNDENVQLPDNKGRRHTEGDAQDVEPNVLMNDWRNADQLQYDEGEITFRTDSFITYSGPIPFSGYLSDGSAASGKSFAFPVLRSSNSSPVGMARGNRRRLKKHKDWKLHLLCCKF